MGTSPESNTSSPAVPLVAQPPRAPLITSALGRDGQALVEWVAPAFDGGSPITAYTLVARDDQSEIVSTQILGASARSATVTGLTNGRVLDLDLTASNLVGESPAASGEVTPAPVYAPSAPRDLMVVPAGSGAVDVTWAAPEDDGGSPVSGYRVTYQRAVRSTDGWQVLDGVTVHELTSDAATTAMTATTFEDPGAMYLFSVAARNVAGTGESASSSAG